MRFSLKHDLNVVLGKKNEFPRISNYLGNFYPPLYFQNQAHFKREYISNTIWERAHLEYDMIYCHTRWDHSAISNVLNDKGDVFYFSILRDPVEQFRSFWDFYHMGRIYNTTLEEYTRNIIYNETISKSKSQRSMGYNQMLTDFGVDFEDMITNGTDKDMESAKYKIKQKVEEIDKNFDLIIFTDYYEDSMVLLKNSLCWEYEDIIGLKRNTARQKSQMSKEAKRIIKSWLWADYILYDYFLEKFKKKKADFGQEKLMQEKTELRKTLNTTVNACNTNPADEFCSHLGKAEHPFLDEIRARQTLKSLKILNNKNFN